MEELDRYGIWQRIEKLIDRAVNAADDVSGAGPLSQADFDELEILADALRSELPKKFLQIVGEGYQYYSSDQKNVGQRLKRIAELDELLPVGRVEYDDDSMLIPTFSLPEADKTRVLELSTDIRKIVLASSLFDEPHKRRLLNRVAAIEQEIHQPKGKMDVVLGGVVDVGEALGKFGEKIKPLTDRMSEIRRIVGRNSDDYSQLPAPEEVKQLPAPDEEDEK